MRVDATDRGAEATSTTTTTTTTTTVIKNRAQALYYAPLLKIHERKARNSKGDQDGFLTLDDLRASFDAAAAQLENETRATESSAARAYLEELHGEQCRAYDTYFLNRVLSTAGGDGLLEKWKAELSGWTSGPTATREEKKRRLLSELLQADVPLDQLEGASGGDRRVGIRDGWSLPVGKILEWVVDPLMEGSDGSNQSAPSQPRDPTEEVQTPLASTLEAARDPDEAAAGLDSNEAEEGEETEADADDDEEDDNDARGDSEGQDDEDETEHSDDEGVEDVDEDDEVKDQESSSTAKPLSNDDKKKAMSERLARLKAGVMKSKMKQAQAQDGNDSSGPGTRKLPNVTLGSSRTASTTKRKAASSPHQGKQTASAAGGETTGKRRASTTSTGAAATTRKKKQPRVSTRGGRGGRGGGGGKK